MPKTPGYEYRCDSNPLIFQGTYILSYIAAFFTTLLVEQIEQSLTHIRIYVYTQRIVLDKTSTSSLHSLCFTFYYLSLISLIVYVMRKCVNA